MSGADGGHRVSFLRNRTDSRGLSSKKGLELRNYTLNELR
jgi:hypothetical protein